MRSDRPWVKLGIPPGFGRLDAWGLDIGGQWWALIVWDETIKRGDTGHVPVPCAAWTPGLHVHLNGPMIDYLHVPRTRLGAEPAEWPPPKARPGAVWQPNRSFYLGVLDGSIPQLPAGVRRFIGQGSAYG